MLIGIRILDNFLPLIINAKSHIRPNLNTQFIHILDTIMVSPPHPFVAVVGSTAMLFAVLAFPVNLRRSLSRNSLCPVKKMAVLIIPREHSIGTMTYDA